MLAGLCLSAPAIGFEASDYIPDEVDLRLSQSRDKTNFNPVIWGKAWSGGANLIFNPSVSQEHNTAGLYFRPNTHKKDLPDIVLAVEHVNADSRHIEGQGHIIMPSGFGVGGGFVQSPYGSGDLWFAKFLYQNKFKGINFIASPLIEGNDSKVNAGGYGAVYTDEVFFGGNISDEQWRLNGAFIAPENESMFQPAVEVRYTDTDIGDFDGTQTVNIHFTLKYVGGFFRHASRLGRALGPAANVYQNPVSYLGSNWNRLYDLWEIGGLTNARLTHQQLGTGLDATNFQVIAFPAQYAKITNWTAGFFAGYEGNFLDGANNEDIAILGYSKKFTDTRFSLLGKHNFETDEYEIILGLIFAL